VKTPVSQVDLLPTVLAVLGHKAPKHAQGWSLYQMSPNSPPIFAEGFSEKDFSVVKAIIAGDRKLILHQPEIIEVFDINSDRHENRNLYNPANDDMSALRATLEKWHKSKPRLPELAPAKVTKEELERLKSIGYVQ